jgi:hypothetical protein
MASLTRLRRRVQRWNRYAEKINRQYGYRIWNGTFRDGHMRASRAHAAERNRRLRLAEARYTPTCFDCGLPDYHRGRGDGIGSCDCPRCQGCGAGPEQCDCWAKLAGCEAAFCGDPDCTCDDDGEWPEDVFRPVETIQPAGGVL